MAVMAYGLVFRGFIGLFLNTYADRQAASTAPAVHDASASAISFCFALAI